MTVVGIKISIFVRWKLFCWIIIIIRLICQYTIKNVQLMITAFDDDDIIVSKCLKCVNVVNFKCL